MVKLNYKGTNKGYNDGVKSVISSETFSNTDIDKIVLCKHVECKDEPTCLRYVMAKMRKEELDELEESFPNIDREELEGMF